MIEVLVALLLLVITGTALIQTLLTAQRAQRVSGDWMRAVMLAEQAIERGRLETSGGSDTVGQFHRRWASALVDDTLGLRRVDVVVEWDVPHAQRFTLSTLVRQ